MGKERGLWSFRGWTGSSRKEKIMIEIVFIQDKKAVNFES